MKIKSNFLLKHNEFGASVIRTDAENEKVDVSLSNEHFVFLWNYLSQNESTKEQLLNALLDKFDISTVLALNDIDIFLKQLNKNGILEI